jgi:hypothetical protein
MNETGLSWGEVMRQLCERNEREPDRLDMAAVDCMMELADTERWAVDSAYDSGFSDGDSSARADWEGALAHLVPDELVENHREAARWLSERIDSYHWKRLGEPVVEATADPSCGLCNGPGFPSCEVHG